MKVWVHKIAGCAEEAVNFYLAREKKAARKWNKGNHHKERDRKNNTQHLKEKYKIKQIIEKEKVELW
jgi:hypothetical protein